MDQLINGELCPENHQLFQELYHALLFGDNGGMADPYFVLKDLPSFLSTQRRVGDAYLDRDRWLKMAVINTAKSGVFAADRTIAEYNEKIWHLEALGAVIFHDSRDARFRFPGGARPLGETVRLSVRADGAKSATLRLWKDGREWRVPMARVSSDPTAFPEHGPWHVERAHAFAPRPGEDVFTCEAALPEDTGCLWYYFILEYDNSDAFARCRERLCAGG